MAFVYGLCSRTSRKVYVGATNNLKRRLRNHRSSLMNNCDWLLARAVRKYGWDDFVVVVLAQGINET